MPKQPNFLIVGAAKCGTTSLFEYLRQHPQIYMPPCKEVSFFAGKMEATSMSFEDYLTFFSHAKHRQKIGEASGAYLFANDAPKNIASTLGNNLKILIILRNPVNMSYALWGQNFRDGNEDCSFEDAFSLQDKRLRDKSFIEKIRIWRNQYAYFDRAIYAPQVKRYYDIFGRDNTKVIIFEEFFADIERSLNEVYAFLGVDPASDISEYKNYNASGKVRSKLVHKFYSEEHLLTNTIRKIIPAPTRRGLIGLLYKLNSTSSPRKALPPELRAKIKDKFMPSISELELLLNKKLKHLWA